jgi:CATRA-associated small protein
VQSDYGLIGDWLDTQLVRDAREVLGYLDTVSRLPAEWRSIAEAVDRLETALRSGDPAQVASATSVLERMTGTRVDDLGPDEDAPPPPPLHDRMVHLQRQLDVDHKRLREGGEDHPRRR